MRQKASFRAGMNCRFQRPGGLLRAICVRGRYDETARITRGFGGAAACGALLDRLAAVAGIPPGRGSSRVRPGDPDWPSAAKWDGLRQRVGGRLIAVQSLLEPCREAPIGEACRTLFRELKNPYYIGDEVGLTQTTGWVDAWTLEQSAFAVA